MSSSGPPGDGGVPEAVTYREIKEILRTFRESGWSGMTVELHGIRIAVGKDGPPSGSVADRPAPARRDGRPVPADGRPTPDDRQTSPDEGRLRPRSGLDDRSRSAVEAPARPAPPAVPSTEDDLLDVRSPAVGAFWTAPSPGQPPFVEVGQVVAQDEQLAIVEVMKLMNPVVAPAAGTVVEVCAANSDLVEYEQVLFRIRPDDG